jgi:hypothetical protein
MAGAEGSGLGFFPIPHNYHNGYLKTTIKRQSPIASIPDNRYLNNAHMNELEARRLSVDFLALAGRNAYIVDRSDRSAATALPRPETGPRVMRDRRKPKRLPRDYHTAGRLRAPLAVFALPAGRMLDPLAAQHLHREHGEPDDPRSSRPARRRDRIGAFHEQAEVAVRDA